MAKRKRTLSELLGDLADVVDMPAFTTTGYVTKARATRLLNESGHSFMQKPLAFGLLATKSTISVVVGTTEYSLPDDFANLIGLETVPTGVNASYEILGEKLVVSDPTQAYTITLRYAPETPFFDNAGTALGDMSADDDYVLSKGGIDRWMVLDAAAKIQARQQIDASALIFERDDIEANLTQNLLDRDAANPQYVRNDWDAGSAWDPRGPGCD